jgi:hypothetical protein
MKSRDQLLLEQAYERVLIQEDPDTCIIGDGSQIGYESGGDVTFGFCNVGSEPFESKIQRPQGRNHGSIPVIRFEGFDNTNFGKLLTSKHQGDTHLELAIDVIKMISKATQGKITFLRDVMFLLDGRDELLPGGHIIDMSDPVQRTDELVQGYFEYLFEKAHDYSDFDFNTRLFLEPAGRIWVNQPKIQQAYGNNVDSVISFWAERHEVAPEHYQKLVDHFKIIPQRTMVEFLGDEHPSTTLDKLMRSSSAPAQPEMSDEEKQARNKRKAEALAKVHGAAAVGTQDKDVRDVIDQRKKATSDLESQLRASGKRPSLAARQQAMSSESLNVLDKDQILLEQAYSKVANSKFI